MAKRSTHRSSGQGKAPTPLPWDITLPSKPAGDRAMWWITGLSLLFLFSALVALAVVPVYLNREVSLLQDRVQTVLAPAERYTAQIELSQTNRNAALEAYLFSGNSRFRQHYRDAYREERQALDSLQALTDELGMDIGEAHTRVIALSLPWNEGHRAVLNEEVGREDFLQDWDTERARYDEILSATRALRGAVANAAAAGRQAVQSKRDQEDLITRGLLFFGPFLPLLVLLFLGWRYQSLMRETDAFRRAATRARREADALLAATGDGVVGIDVQGKCRFLNRAGAERLGYSTRMVIGRDIHDLLHHTGADGTPNPRSECVILKALETGEPISERNEILWGAGRNSFPVQISLRPLKDGGQVRGAVLTFTDMTATRAAEVNLKKAIQARDEVLAVVSHDLRNPVGTIFSAASLLLDLPVSEEKRRDHLHSIKRSAGRMNRLIQDLLDVARMEAGVFRVASDPFQVSELLEEVVFLHGAAARKSGLLLRCRMRDAHTDGWGDRDRVLQVLSNLVENALKFTPEGGEVEVGARREPEEGGILYWVSDTGPGIREPDQKYLFDRFWQVSRRGKKSAGLGLSIVKGLVEAHQGNVWVESEAGKGSTFLFLLPERKDEAPEETIPPPSGP